MRIRENKLFTRQRKLALRLKEDFHFSKWQNSGFKVCFSFSSNCVCASVSYVICKNVLWNFAGDWQSTSLVVTPSHLVLTRFLNTFCSFLIVLPRIFFILFRDFFTWLFQSGKEQLEVLAAIDIPAIQGLVSPSIFLCSSFRQTANFIQKIRFSNGIFHFSQFSRDGLSG